MSLDDLPVFVRWYKFLDWLMSATEKFPKRVRFTVSSRLDNTALDVLEHIIEAAYTRDKLAILRKANLKLEKLRVMLRLSYDRKYLAGRSYEYGIRQMHETGKMLGGWIKSVEKR